MKAGKWKRAGWAFAFFAFLGMAAAADAGGQQSGKTQAADVEKEFREALQALKNYSAGQREQAVEKIKAAMDALNAEIDRLNEEFGRNWDRMDKAGREKAAETLKSLRKKSNDLAEWYGALKHGSADAWEQVKNGFAESYEVLSKHLEDAVRELHKNRPPGYRDQRDDAI